ncbi:MAG: DNA translocase FtsK [Chloroflexi bacterium]|nr:DNA translocase FtsK [Chloroflexota bacterium]
MTRGRRAAKRKADESAHWLSRRPMRLLLLVGFFTALLFWQKQNISAAVAGIAAFLGWGLLLIVLALAVPAVMMVRHEFVSFLRYIYRWLGLLGIILAVWGILGFFNLGGDLGRNIIGRPASFLAYLGGGLRVLALAAIGIALLAPRASFDFVAAAVAWIHRKVETRSPRKAAPRPPVLPLFKARKPPAEAGSPAPVPDEGPREVAKEAARVVTVDGWRLPPIDILDRVQEIEFGQADNMRRARLVEEALASYGVEAKVVQINAGPTVTQFGVEPGWDRKFKEIKERDKDGNVKSRQEEVSRTRVKVEKITSLANDLALALAAPSLRIEAPVPGKSIIGIEVPNTISSVVSLRSVVESSSFQKLLAKTKLTLALGKGAGGETVAGDLTKMPHLLIAGATGSGKTVCLQTIVCCLLLHDTPSDVRFVMIDPKRVELTAYNSIPHLAAPVIVDTNKALGALRWLNQEMDERYKKLAAAGARNIESYNKNRQGSDRMPFLVLIIDELADLMMAGFDEVETILCRLAQLARAIGIHLVVATQRPSVDVVTGLIKANFPTRISFAVTSQVDSRTILDTGGAEKLLGKGDMLYAPTEAAKPKRLQGCFVSDAEMERLVYFWSRQSQELSSLRTRELFSPAAQGPSQDADPLLAAARDLARGHEHISVSFLQRQLHIGYSRAAKLMELLEKEGAGPPDGADPPEDQHPS